ncbi:MAG: SDR family NAD(P)-dependent oxidoreductase [Gammaproteobacteria bacterium]|nr:SDR family NAD(P)-dependent oxidoreductase [Gammaproteobacteria bacterium]MYE50211.1 SDR family NAD(P)-dependent oxidoreductase [Gammaproteobacteria bacterium]MYF49101.1 SDR family NAD(P)-dependent oxidoreductase [Gammaproteobacteria bacterium]
MSWYQGKHAVVTGGGSGIGLAIARQLVDQGAKVTVTGRSAQRLQAAASALGAAFQVADVTCREALRGAFAAAAQDQGTVDILVNNAGGADAAPFARMSDQQWDQALAVNLTGVFNCTKAVIGDMLERGSGRVVNVASTAGLVGYAYVAAYCAAKHGVIGLTRALAQEYARKGITINAVCPGYTDTDIVQRSLDRIIETTGRSREQALADLVQSNPKRRLVRPEEVADTVIWLCRQESMNGQAIAVADGEVM